MSAYISQLWVYPVKACQGMSVPELCFQSPQLSLDRVFAFVEQKEQKILTQTNMPRLAAIKTHLSQERLTLAAQNHGEIQIKLNGSMQPVVPKDNPMIEDMGNGAAEWVQDFLKVDNIRLVRRSANYPKIVSLDQGISWNINFNFRSPLHIISEASVADLSQRAQENIPADRFRANIVLSGIESYAEDYYKALIIGPNELVKTTACIRCIYTTTDQKSGLRVNKQPLAALQKYRKTDKGVSFGQYFTPTSLGIIRISDDVMVVNE